MMAATNPPMNEITSRVDSGIGATLRVGAGLPA